MQSSHRNVKNYSESLWLNQQNKIDHHSQFYFDSNSLGWKISNFGNYKPSSYLTVSGLDHKIYNKYTYNY